MDSFLIFSMLACFLLHLFLRRFFGRHRLPLPPGPTNLPVIGALPFVGPTPHSGLARLARRYAAPIMYLKMGTSDVVVVSTPSAAKAFLKTLDSQFAHRPTVVSATDITYNYSNMVFSNYGNKWKLMRKLASLHLLGAKAVAGWAPVRRDEMGIILKEVCEAAAVKKPVVVPELLVCCLANVVGQITLSKRVFDVQGEESNKYKDMIVELLTGAGLFNIGDFIPALAWLDLQGVQAKLKGIHDRFDAMITKMLEEHSATAKERDGRPDFIDLIMANRVGEDGETITDTNIKGLIFVSQNKCWRFDQAVECNQDMLNHLNASTTCLKKDAKFPWDDDMYLKPYLEEDPLLHSLSMDDDDYDDDNGDVSDIKLMDREEIIKQFNGSNLEKLEDQFGKLMENGVGEEESKEGNLKVVRKGAAARERKYVDEDYFGAYSSFGIHREMLSDKVRTDAYRDALLNNPSLLNEAVVIDVGCGTGILSLFAAQAGASKVVSVDASAKMASVATQIAKDNNAEVITVVHSMVEDIERNLQLEPKSVDVLVSEWMGYCLLYESMLSSVLFARDCYLKPGGAILPDTATIFGAGFGKGGTSMPFWENVYGFNMSCVGKELVQDAARMPIVDTIDPLDIITESAVVHSFDLVTMTQEDMDFTSTIELHLRPSHMGAHISWCHGLVLWFDTSFTDRFCKENPTTLSTSPFGPKTHWAQTILTFREPIAMCSENGRSVISAAVLSKEIGTEECPVSVVRIRVSIARASHRSIGISLETTAVGFDGKKNWPVQIFTL